MAWGAKGTSGVSDLVKRLADNDGRLKELHVMRMRKLDDAGVKDLCKAFERNTVCTTFYASGHTMTPSGAGTVGAMLAVNTSLRSLCIGDEAFGDDALASLADGLGASCCLHLLDLENKNISSTGVQRLCAALEGNSRLQTLKLSKNDLSADGLRPFHGRKLNLEHLVLQGCSFMSAAFKDAAPWNMPALKSLDLSDNPLSPDSGAGLSALLHSCSHSLQRLVLTGTEIGDVGAAAMASQLAHLTALTHLDLSGCSITSVGAASIGAGLVAAQPVGLVLAEVLLTNNNLTAGDRPCSVFFDGLKSLPTLTFLELGNCSLSAAAVAELAAVTSLTTLSVFGNSTGDEVLVKMSEAMGTLGAGGQQRPRAFCTLHVLSLSGNKLSLDGLRTFLEALVQLPKEVLKWRELEVGANPGCEESELEAAVNLCSAAIPSLKVVWRASDIQTSRILPAFPEQAETADT